MKIPIFQIKVNEGRREAESEAVQKLADSISKVGLLNPITVDQDYTLIAGLHRLEAAKRLGWTEIKCTVSNLEGLQAELAEIDENFVRKDLSDDEFRELLLRRKEIYESLHPEAKATYEGGAFRGNQHQKVVAAKNAATTKSFVQDTAERTGKSPRTIRQAIQTAKNITPEAKSIIQEAGTKVTKSDALKLSRLPPEQQEDVASQLAAGNIHSVDEYQPVPAEPPPAPQASEGYYPTTKDSVDDLKNPDKDRSRTPDMFLATFSFFLQRLCQSIANYSSPEYSVVFPALTQAQLTQLHEEINTVCTDLRNLFHKMERMAQT